MDTAVAAVKVQLIIQVIVSAVLAAALTWALIAAITSKSLWVFTAIVGVLGLGLITIAWLTMRPAEAITLFVVVFSLLLAILLIAMWLW